MRNTLFTLLFLITAIAYGQKTDIIQFQGKVTTTIRDGFDVPPGEMWLIYNATTDQLEIGDSNEIWVTAGAGIQEGVNSISSLYLSNTLQNGIEIGIPADGLFGSNYYTRIYGGGQPDGSGLLLAPNRVELLNQSIADIDLNGGKSLLTYEWFFDKYVPNTDNQDASEVAFTPYGTIGATTLQLAIQEMLDEATTGGSTSLSGLTDTDINSPISGQLLVSDGVNFVNRVINADEIVFTPTTEIGSTDMEAAIVEVESSKVGIDANSPENLIIIAVGTNAQLNLLASPPVGTTRIEFATDVEVVNYYQKNDALSGLNLENVGASVDFDDVSDWSTSLGKASVSSGQESGSYALELRQTVAGNFVSANLVIDPLTIDGFDFGESYTLSISFNAPVGATDVGARIRQNDGSGNTTIGGAYLDGNGSYQSLSIPFTLLSSGDITLQIQPSESDDNFTGLGGVSDYISLWDSIYITKD